MTFCRWGTSSIGHAMPRSPRATMMASAFSRRAGSAADGGRRLDLGHQARPIGPGDRPHGVEIVRRRARRRRPGSRSRRPSRRAAMARSSSVGQARRTFASGRCTPGRPWTRPPVTTRTYDAFGLDAGDGQHDGAVAEHHAVAALDVLQQARVLDGHHLGRGRPVPGRPGARWHPRRGTRRRPGTRRSGPSGPAGRRGRPPGGRPRRTARGSPPAGPGARPDRRG